MQPSGPYHLLGRSFGGIVAHAVAAEDEPAELPTEQGHLRGLLHVFAPEQATRLPDPLDATEVLATIRAAGTAFARFDERQFNAMRDVLLNNHRLTLSHHPPHFGGDAVLFTATRERVVPPPSAEDWAPFVGGTVNVREIACAHHEMTAPTALAEIGKVLAPWFDGE